MKITPLVVQSQRPYFEKTLLTCKSLSDPNLKFYDFKPYACSFVRNQLIYVEYSSGLIYEDQFTEGCEMLVLSDDYKIFVPQNPASIKPDVVSKSKHAWKRTARQLMNTVAVTTPALAVAAIATPTVAAPVLAVGLCTSVVNEFTKVRD